MAEARLDIVGDFGELFPNLDKLGKAQEGLRDKSTELAASMKSSFEAQAQAAQNVTDHLKKQTDQVALATNQIETLKKKIADLRAALDANKSDSGLVSVLTKELQKTEQELIKAGGAVEKFTQPIVDNNKKSSESIKGLRGQIMAAMVDLESMFQQYGKGSKEVDQAAARVAILKDRQDEFNKLIEALDPDRKFNAFAQVVRGGTAAVETVVGALALFGEKNEVVERSLVRIQALMTFTRGVNELLEFGKVWNSIRAVLGLSTAATTANTVATNVNTESKAVNNVVTTTGGNVTKVYSIWTNIATIATVAFNAALKALSGPVGWIIGAIGIVIGLFAAFSKEGEHFSDTLDAMKNSADRFADASDRLEQRNKDAIKNADNALSVFKSSEEARIAKLKEGGAKEKELADQKNKLGEEVLAREIAIQNKIAEQADLDIERNKFRIQQLVKNINDIKAAIDSGDLSKEELGKATDQSSAAKKEIDDLVKTNGQKIQIQNDADAQILQLKNNFNKQVSETNTDANKKTTDEEKKLREDRLRAEKEFQDQVKALRDKTLQSEAAHADGEAQLNAARQIALNEIADLEKKLIEKGKVVDKNFKLSLDQQKQFETLRLAVERDFVQKSVELQNAKALEYVNATQTGLNKLLAVFDLNFAKRAEDLKKLGLTEIQIENIKNNEILKIRTDFAGKQLDVEAEKAKAVIDQINISGVSEAQAERIRNEKRLEVDLEFAKKKLFFLESQRTLENNPELEADIAKAKADIAKFGRSVDAAKKELIDNSEKFSLGRLFGFTGDDADKFNQAAAQFLGSALQIGDTLLANSIANVDAQIENNQRLIADYDNRINEIDALIEKEQQRNDKGLANNLDARRREEVQLKAARDKALAEEKKNHEEKRKLLKEQAILNAAATASQLIVSTVNVIESLSSLPFGIGVVLGLAAAASLVSGFLQIKKSISAAESQALEYGGLVGGKAHSEGGGNKYVSQDGNKILYTERGEYYTNRRATAKNLNLLNAINFNRRESVELDEVMPFLKKSRIALSRDIAKPINDKTNEFNSYEMNYTMAVAGELRDEIRDTKKVLHQEVSEINERQKSLPQYHTNEHGKLVKTVVRGNVEEITIYDKQ